MKIEPKKCPLYDYCKGRAKYASYYCSPKCSSLINNATYTPNGIVFGGKALEILKKK